jgi:signal transduction histidine kinase/ActR/RegA family two-component response regulator
MNPVPKRKFTQKLTVYLLVLIAALTIIALVSRQIISQKGKFLLSVIDSNNYPAEQSGDVLVLLNQADNDFQSAVLAHNAQKLALYKAKLQQAFLKIDSIRRHDVDTSFILNHRQREETRALYQQKLRVSNEIFALKSSFDAVLLQTERYTGKGTQADLLDSVANVARKRTAAQLQKEDTVKVEAVVTTTKKGFFKKLQAAFSGGKDTMRQGGGTFVNKLTEKSYRDSINRTVILNADASFQQLLKTLRLRQNQLSASQASLFATNLRIMEQLKLLVIGLQHYSQSLSNNLKSIALNEYHSTQTLLDNMGIISLLLVFIFSLLLIVYIKKINSAEEHVWQKYELATSLAQQKTDLLATMSHEIRNPLNAIIGFLNEFKKSGLSEKQAEMLDSVQLSSDMLLGTVTDVLDMSKLESGQFQLQAEQFNPYNTLRLTTESMRFNAHQKKLLLNYHFTGDKQLNMTGDAFRLKQIVINLLSNAIKYTSQGSVSVKAVLKQEGNKMLLEIAVTDTGTGILKAQQAKLFTKYYQTSSSKGTTGTGLGLYICYKLIQLQQGNIHIDSTPGKGTSISFSIPYTQVQMQSVQVSNSDTAVDISVFGGKRILVADDNELNLKLISIMTQRWDVTLLLARNGQEAFDLLQKEPVDLVVTDMEMAEMNGAELVTAIRNNKSLSHLPVVLSTAYRYNDAELEELYRTGFTTVITKPFNETLLANKLFIALQTIVNQSNTKKAIN